MKPKALFSWIGTTDLMAAKGKTDKGPGPIAATLDARQFDYLFLLSNFEETENNLFIDWIQQRSKIEVELFHTKLTSPTDYEEIYSSINDFFEKTEAYKQYEITYNVSSGTPAMATTWVIFATTRYNGTLVESSLEAGVKEIIFPFRLTAELLEEKENETREQVRNFLYGIEDKIQGEFKNVIYDCDAMKEAIAMAMQASLFDIPVLILGETGTGKEVFARAIHDNKIRQRAETHESLKYNRIKPNRPFVSVNCGAIPSTMVESELFRQIKGYATDMGERNGFIQQAHNGTLFLDEIGELPLDSQVKLLRILQDKKVKKLGEPDSKLDTVDFNLIAATNRDLIKEVNEGRFREDLFHRIAVGTIKLPPLRARGNDIRVLADFFLSSINERFRETKQAGVNIWRNKKLTEEAIHFIYNYHWPGNVRELENTLIRAAIWTTGSVDEDNDTQYINEQDIERSIFSFGSDATSSLLEREMDDRFSIEDIFGAIYKHYYIRAMEKAKGTKKVMKDLLGLATYQTMDNWYKEYVENRGLGPSLDELYKKH